MQPQAEVKQEEDTKIRQPKAEEEKEEQKQAEPEEKKENDPVEKLIQSQRGIDEEEFKNAGKIIISEEEGNLLNGKSLTINAKGMEGGRNMNDGVAIFGKLNQDEENSKENIFKPDFELNYEEKLNYPYIFAIYYDKEQKKFFIRAFSGKGSDNRILFIKLNGQFGMPLTQKEIISAGNIIFQITPLENNSLEVVNLSKKELSTMPKQKFSASNKKEVTIGRNKDCDFAFPKDKSFSRFQTTIEFDEENQQWVINDGTKNKPSTNGTWVFGTHSFPINNDMTVEILTTKIKIKYEKA